MRLATRTFWLSFVPLAVLLTASFWAVRVSVLGAVRDSMRAAARENQKVVAREHSKDAARMARTLRAVAENPELEAGVQLLLAEQRDTAAARRTVEDQLAVIGKTLGFDLLVVSGNQGTPLAGVLRIPGAVEPTVERAIEPLDPARLQSAAIEPGQSGFFTSNGRVYQITPVPIEQGDEVLGSLLVGDQFDPAEYGAPVVLLRNGTIVESDAPGVDRAEAEAALSACPPTSECEVRLHGESYLSLPLGNQPNAVYSLRSLQSVEAASGPVQAGLRNVFLLAGAAMLIGAVVLSAVSSRSIVRPISRVVEHLRASQTTGVLAEFGSNEARIQEIRELAENFNRAAASIRQGREDLVQAYVEFAGSLAHALDARDAYTAGHSRRVSLYSCAIARAMRLPPATVEVIRIGALLHDLGKIGISDGVLLKEGRLTPEETALIQQHPVIGRRILEGVQGFHPYLGVVELHHEDWDGSGYPHGLKGAETPLEARIVKVADAFDAMTSDRPYRRGMSAEKARLILTQVTGTQVDPAVMEAFSRLDVSDLRTSDTEEPSVARLRPHPVLHESPVNVGTNAINGAGNSTLNSDLQSLSLQNLSDAVRADPARAGVSEDA
jgi:HD-GYP domain-containing protein (c-di-GMP phosphodiesterase class II)